MFFKMHESLHFNLLYPRNKACNTQMNNSNILVKSDIDHLVSLQHSDPGFFVLAVYSFIKGYLRNRDELSYEQATFGELITLLREDLKASRYLSAQDFQFLNTFGSGVMIANRVRHSFPLISGEELIASVFRLKQFAQLNEFYSN